MSYSDSESYPSTRENISASRRKGLRQTVSRSSSIRASSNSSILPATVIETVSFNPYSTLGSNSSHRNNSHSQYNSSEGASLIVTPFPTTQPTLNPTTPPTTPPTTVIVTPHPTAYTTTLPPQRHQSNDSSRGTKAVLLFVIFIVIFIVFSSFAFGITNALVQPFGLCTVDMSGPTLTGLLIHSILAVIIIAIFIL